MAAGALVGSPPRSPPLGVHEQVEVATPEGEGCPDRLGKWWQPAQFKRTPARMVAGSGMEDVVGPVGVA